MKPTTVLAVCLLLGAFASAEFYPFPGISHADHNDDHVGYWITMRIHQLLPGVTVQQATDALTAYLYQISARDDVIEYIAFYNNQTQEYITTGLWRDRAGSEASFAFALTRANYKLFMSQSVEYAGTVQNFFENQAIHSESALGLYRQMRISSLEQPTKFNITNIPAIVQANILPVAQTLPGIFDYTTTYPTVPFANVFWMTEKTYSNRSVFAAGDSQLEPTVQQFLGDKLLNDIFYEGQITVFWHSAPGVTAALPAGVSAPVLPAAPGITCVSEASALTVGSTFFTVMVALLLQL
jgi:hypothetical protein